MSKHVGNVTEVSHLMKISVRNKPMEKLVLRDKAEDKYVFTQRIHFYHSGGWKCLTKDWKYVKQHTEFWCLSHRGTSPLPDLFGRDLNNKWHLSRRHRVNEVGDLFRGIWGMKALEYMIQIFKLRYNAAVCSPSGGMVLSILTGVQGWGRY